jgi:hypothetical protein
MGHGHSYLSINDLTSKISKNIYSIDKKIEKLVYQNNIHTFISDCVRTMTNIDHKDIDKMKIYKEKIDTIYKDIRLLILLYGDVYSIPRIHECERIRETCGTNPGPLCSICGYFVATPYIYHNMTTDIKQYIKLVVLFVGIELKHRTEYDSDVLPDSDDQILRAHEFCKKNAIDTVEENQLFDGMLELYRY